MAYAALISLKYAMTALVGGGFPFTTSKFGESGMMVKSLKEVLEELDDDRKRRTDRSVINELDSKIREAAWKFEDVIQSYMLNQFLPPGDIGGPQIRLADKNGVEQEIVSFLETVKELREEYTREVYRPLPREEDDAVFPLPTDDFGAENSTTVGLADQYGKIRDELVDLRSGTRIVSLVGMAGIGKTHLARDIYQDPIILQHFGLLVWVSIGLKYETRSIFVDILVQIERKPRNTYTGMDMNALSLLLHKTLYGRKCLIVFDDIWSVRVCQGLRGWLPEAGNQRRLLLTTRSEEVVDFYSTTIHKIRFLDDRESWNLLCQNVFGDEPFPPQLEKAGRKIAKNCEGLPLLILTVADILRGLDMTEEYWMKVADKKTTTFTDAYEIIEEVLISSYEYLPQYLKAYFLYMGVFPQSSVIPVPKLINLWTVEEDFSESSLCQTSAYYNLTRLVSNSLVIVCKQSYNYTNKSCRLHSAYWHLGVKEARKNKFFHVLRKLSDASEEYIGSQHRLSIQNNILFGIKEVYDWMAATLTTRSLLCTGEDHKYPVRIFLNLMLLKVLDALSIRFYEFPTEVVKLLQLSYLALTHNGNVPSSISQLRRLKFLILRPHHNIKLLRDSTCLPVEIWHLLQLRYLRIRGSNLPDIPGQMWYNDHPNLVTLYVNAHSCRRAVFKHIPYLMKLGIEIELQPDAAEPSSCFEYTNLLYNLESVKCVVVNPGLGSRVVAPPDHLSNLPRSLKKLSLNGLGYPWEYMSAIGALPNLQALCLSGTRVGNRGWRIPESGISAT